MDGIQIADQVQVALPDSYFLVRLEGGWDSLYQVYSNQPGTLDGPGKRLYVCSLHYLEGDGGSSELAGHRLADRIADVLAREGDYLWLPGPPPLVFTAQLDSHQPIMVGHRIYYVIELALHTETKSGGILSLKTQVVDPGCPHLLEVGYENLLAIGRCIRVGGRRLPLEDLSAKSLIRGLLPVRDRTAQVKDYWDAFRELDGDDWAEGNSLTIEFAWGECRSAILPRSFPEADQFSLYSDSYFPLHLFDQVSMPLIPPHLENEIALIRLEDLVQDTRLPISLQTLLTRLSSQEGGPYKGGDKAREIKEILASQFSDQNLLRGFIPRASMLHMLRSFAWTLEEFCRTEGLDREQVTDSILDEILQTCVMVHGLNYRQSDSFVGLCWPDDTETFYLPGGLAPLDYERFANQELATPSRIGEVGLAPLQALQEDLEDLSPIISRLTSRLLTKAATDSFLGHEVDMVRTWCQLALAAEQPFFMTSGLIDPVFMPLPSEEPLEGVCEQEWEIKGDCLIRYRGSEANLTLPDGVAKIGPFAFALNRTLQSLTACAPLDEVGEEAFASCHALEQVILPEGVHTIGSCAFSDCRRLTRLALPAGLASIGSSAFYACEKLREVVIPPSVTSIGLDAFYRVAPDFSITLTTGSVAEAYAADNGIRFTSRRPAALLPARYFPRSDLRTKRRMYLKSRLGYRGKAPACRKVFRFFPKWWGSDDTLFTYLGREEYLILPQSYQHISRMAFMDRVSLKVVVLPEHMKEIGELAFANCFGLSYLIMPDHLEVIGSSAFANCSQLKELVIPATCTFVGGGAFEGCHKLKNVYILSSDIHFGEAAFPLFRRSDLLFHVIPESDVEAYVKRYHLQYLPMDPQAVLTNNGLAP